ncbi:MAG: hypothetical protein COB93_10660 [Sneathiella sp.]|nr:MAG: hypothetical protein COB93_10660 [Sneathiella sp.]
MDAPAIELVGINKSFGPVRANHDIHMSVAPGTIHGIIGENGAGKSTLMSILYGFYQADSGEIKINGKPVKISSSQEAIALGIGMVHQHFMLVHNFSVLENIILGVEGGPFLGSGIAHARKELARLEEEYALEVDPEAIIEDLPVGIQQRVEILKALYRGADILILDEPTGVLTTLQRAQAYANYNAVLEGMDLAVVYDRQAGIAMQMPTGVVAFSEYSPPFARYRPTGGLDVEVLLISQEGNQDRFFGLYEILQTLDMIPPEGPRERSSNSFTIEGEDARSHTYTFARLADGQIKGFTLIWPAGDEERRGRVLAEMRASFSLAEGVLDPSLAPAGEDQAVDLVSGLEVRKPIRERSGFFIDQNGRAITSAEAVAECREVTLDTEHPAQVVFLDEVLGLAVLEPLTPLAPLGVAAFQPAVPRIGNRVAVAGYPFGGVLAAPALTFGQLADIRGLNGEDTIKRLDLAALPGDFGGPVMDDSGALLGMMLARATDGPVLPGDVSFIADAEAVIATLQTAGIAVDIASGSTPISSAALTRHASDITVLVSCWN